MDDHLTTSLWYSHGEGIEVAVLANGESYVLWRELKFGMSLAETTAGQFLQLAILHLAFAEGAPCLAAIYGFAIDCHPTAYFFEHGDAGVLDAAVW